MTKKKKIITMICPSCGEHFSPEPKIVINPKTGESHMEHHLPKQCKYCSTNLVRSVVKVKSEKKVLEVKRRWKSNQKS